MLTIFWGDVLERPKFSIIDNEERGKQIDEFALEFYELVKRYKLTNIELVWFLTHLIHREIREDLEQ